MELIATYLLGNLLSLAATSLLPGKTELAYCSIVVETPVTGAMDMGC